MTAEELVRLADQRLSWLFTDLQDFTSVSAWVGPSFDYDLPYHEMLAVPRLRPRILVAMLLACLSAIEEHWSMGLASDHERCCAQLGTLTAADADEARLIGLVVHAFELVAHGGLRDPMDELALDREMRWVHARYVHGALDADDAAIEPRPNVL